MIAPTETEAEALRYDPFDQEEGRRNLRDEIVVTRRPHVCVICEEPIVAGARARATTDLQVGGASRLVRTFWHCPTCVAAEAATWTDAGRSFTERLRTQFRRAGAIFPEEAP